MRRCDLRSVSVRYALGLAITDELMDAAHWALDRGIYSHSLGELATNGNPTFADADPLFSSALQELGIPLPSGNDAIDILAESYILGCWLIDLLLGKE